MSSKYNVCFFLATAVTHTSVADVLPGTSRNMASAITRPAMPTSSEKATFTVHLSSASKVGKRQYDKINYCLLRQSAKEAVKTPCS